MSEGLFVGALRTRLVGREREKATIREAIEAEGELRILYLVGEGGIGKTHLLEEVPAILAEASLSGAATVADIVDLYHTSTHSARGIEAAIRAALANEQKAFTKYRRQRAVYHRHRASGVGAAQLEQDRCLLTDLFVEALGVITRKKRLILRFDTAEVMQYESDAVQEICGLGFYDVEVKSWLLNNLGELSNTVILIAGRPRPVRLLHELRNEFGPHLEVLPISAFGEEETIAYFDALETVSDIKGLDVETRRLIHFYTGGHPLLVSLAAALLASDLAVPRDFMIPLEEAQQRSQVEIRAVREQIEQRLIDQIQNTSGDVAVSLPYLAWARKGMNPELLRRLTGWALRKCRQVLKDLSCFTFVKTHASYPGADELVFLHDEMYNLLDRHVLKGMFWDRSRVCREIVAYYDERIAATDGQEREHLIEEQLSYRLLANPQAGYAHYSHLADEALIGHKVGYDLALRDEVLRFFDPEKNPVYAERAVRYYGLSRDRIDRDNAVRWVKRFIAMEEYEQALSVVEKIQASNHPTFLLEAPSFLAPLLLHQAEALLYLGQDYDLALRLLSEAITTFQDIQPDDEYQEWLRDFVIGRSYNHTGYIYARLRRFDRSMEAYLRALPYHYHAEFGGGMADALNNLAWVYGQLGRLREAIVVGRDALNWRHQVGHEYGVGLTFNTLGIVYLRNDQPHRASVYCDQALRLFENLDDKRGIGLARNALGQIRRYLGTLDIYSLKDAGEHFAQSKSHLERSIEIFGSEVKESVRLLEAYNELGCAYRDQAAVHLRHGQAGPDVEEMCHQAREMLHRALELATPELLVEQLDIYEDLAQVEYILERYEQALAVLDEAEALVSQTYFLSRGEGFREIEDPITGIWLMLGKNYLLRGHIALARDAFELAISNYVQADAYFARYSKPITIYHDTFQAIYDRLRGIPLEQLQALRVYAEQLVTGYCLQNSRFLEMFDATLGIMTDI